MEQKLPPLLTGCIIKKDEFYDVIRINEFIDNAGMCKPFYYYSKPEDANRNYDKVLEWIKDDVVGAIIIDSYFFIKFTLKDILSIDTKLEESPKSIYGITKNSKKEIVIKEIDLTLLLNDIKKLDLDTIYLDIF